MSDIIRLDIDIINMRFEYSDTDTVSDVDIRTRIRTDLNPSKRIRFRIRSENIRTIFIKYLVGMMLLRKKRVALEKSSIPMLHLFFRGVGIPSWDDVAQKKKS